MRINNRKILRIFKVVGLSLCNIFWCPLQNLVGGILFLATIFCPKRIFAGTVVVYHNFGLWSTNFGAFIFISNYIDENRAQTALRHNYGHAVQSLFLGYLYLPLRYIPDVISNIPYFVRRRKERGIPDNLGFMEKGADHFGDKFFAK